MSNNSTPNNKWLEQYKREYKRISQAIRRQEQLGYFVPDDVRPIAPSKVTKITKREVDRLSALSPKKIRKSSVWVDKDSGEAYPGLDVVNSHHKPKPSKAKVPKTNPRKPRKPKTKKITTTSTRIRNRRSRNVQTPEAHQPQPPEAQPPQQDYIYDYDEDVPQGREYYPGFEHIAITGYLQQLRQFPNAEGARMLSDWLSRLIDTYGRHAVAVMLDEGSRAGNIVTWETVYKMDNTKAYLTEMVNFLPDLDEAEKLELYNIMEDMESWEPPA